MWPAMLAFNPPSPPLPPSIPPSLSLQIYSICIKIIGFEKAIQQKPRLSSQHTSFSPPHACYSVQDFRHKDLRAIFLRLVLWFSCNCFLYPDQLFLGKAVLLVSSNMI